MKEITWFDEHKTYNLIMCISAARLQLAFCAWFKAVSNITTLYKKLQCWSKLMINTFLKSFLLIDILNFLRWNYEYMYINFVEKNLNLLQTEVF